MLFVVEKEEVTLYGTQNLPFSIIKYYLELSLDHCLTLTYHIQAKILQ